jgi:hypothetical protein
MVEQVSNWNLARQNGVAKCGNGVSQSGEHQDKVHDKICKLLAILERSCFQTSGQIVLLSNDRRSIPRLA